MSNITAARQKLITDTLLGVNDSADLIERAAQQHGEGDEPDHEVGDLQVCLRAALRLMSPAQRQAFYRDCDVRETIAIGLGVEVGDLKA